MDKTWDEYNIVMADSMEFGPSDRRTMRFFDSNSLTGIEITEKLLAILLEKWEKAYGQPPRVGASE